MKTKFKRLFHSLSQLLLILGTAFFVYSPLQAQVLVTPEEALHEMWPNSVITKKSILLTPEEAERAQSQSHILFTDRVFTFYVVELEHKVVGYGGIYTSKIRTKDETSLFVFDPKGVVQGITVIAFYEPTEYLPPKTWLTQFRGKTTTDDVQIRRDIPVITGATLTSTAVAHAARLMLSVWELKFRGPARETTGERRRETVPNKAPAKK